jgi:hypothetical protein
LLSATLLVLASRPAWASIALYLAPEELAASAPLVVEGAVTASRSGVDPVSGALATYTTLAVETVHRGPRSLDRIVIREPGGSYGDVVHEIDAVPVYHEGERVIAFLEAAPDGAARTSSMFLGKFSVAEDARTVARELDGHGLVPSPAAPAVERMSRSDLVSLVSSVPLRVAPDSPRAVLPRATPPELERIVWSDDDHLDGGVVARFALLSPTNPTRWFQVDQGTPIKLNVEPARNPLGDDLAAVDALTRAMDAWTAVPEGRVTVQPGDTAYVFTKTHTLGPAQTNSGLNIVLFGDPYKEIVDPVGCSGILAIGGYWRTSSIGGTVNGVAFHKALSMYVVFNDHFECFLGDRDNLAEVAAHEIGHGLGFGHSSAPDAIMRSSAYGNRGPRLGDDDRDAAHCVYPHRLTLVSPNGGETWEGGTVHAASWSSTAEDGADPGVVSLEHSTDGGATWTRVADGTANDGQWSWAVPNLPGTSHTFRVIRPNRISAGTCSADASNASFTVTSHVARAGVVPEGGGATEGLSIDRGFAGALVLGWEPSCSGEATDYAVYEGSLDALRQGAWDHAPRTCSTQGDPWYVLAPGSGNRFFLIAATAGSQEGALGRSSSGVERPPAASACLPREATPVCE